MSNKSDSAEQNTRITHEQAIQNGMLIAYHAQQTPDAIALIATGKEYTFQQFNARINQLARVLRNYNLGEGDAAALICTNRAEFLEAMFATARTGIRITPINWHLTAKEINYIVENCEAKAIIGDAALSEKLQQVGEQFPQIEAKLSVGGAIEGFTGYDALIETQESSNIDSPCMGGQMLYTSGTTGFPKGVYRKPGAAARAGQEHLAKVFDFKPGNDFSSITGPLYHAAPLAFTCTLPLNMGMGVLIMEQWDCEEFLANVERHKVTHTHLVPIMFHRLLALPEDVKAKYDLSSLRFVIHGAAPCPVHVKQAFMDWVGPIVWEYYAATEGIGTMVPPQVWLKKPGTVGNPTLGALKVVGEDGNEVPTGEIGTVYLKAPDQGKFQYFKDDGKTDKAYRFGGEFFTLGDMGYVDEDGYLFLADRSSDLIISGGVNIYPAEVDAVLLHHPAVADVATVGIPNSEWGEEVRSVVLLKNTDEASEAMSAQLVAFCLEDLAKFKCPRKIDFVDQLPRYDTGKIIRRQVREKYWQGVDKKI